MTDATKPTILVLDDEKNIRRSIEIALEQEGMHVLSAHDAAAALRVLTDRVVDVLLLDIRLDAGVLRTPVCAGTAETCDHLIDDE